MNRFVRMQLLAFAVLTVIGLVAMSVVYLKLPTSFGYNRTDVQLEMPDTGGLYRNANVSYLGTTIGRVDDVTLAPGKVVADIHFDTDADVPANVRAEIQSVSAVGEQFVEFISEGAPSGRLEDGTVLGGDRVRMPQGIGPVLDQAEKLLDSVDDAKMRRVLSESFAAFNGSERDLQRFLDSAQLLLAEARKNTGVTNQLIADAEPVLDSQNRSSDSIRAWTRQLANVTDQLRTNEPQLTDIMNRGPESLGRADKVLRQLQPTLPVLVANLVSVGEVGVVYNRSIEQILVLYPALVSSLITAIEGGRAENEIKVDFNLQINETPPCTTGFIPAADRRSPSDLSVPAQINGLYCKVPQDSQIAPRGARNLPCMEYPGRRAASPAECASNDYRAVGSNPPDTSETGPEGNDPGTIATRPASTGGDPTMTAGVYDPKTGEYAAADGKTYRQGNLASTAKLPKDASMTDVMTNGVA